MMRSKEKKQRLQKILYPLGILLVLILITGGTLLYKNRKINPELPDPPLHTLAAVQGLQFGNYASLGRQSDPIYEKILTSQFNFVLLDGEPNWTFNDGSLRPSKDTFDFTNPDKVVAYAEAHNMPIQAHHLVWGEEKWIPEWLKKGSFSKAELLDIIHQHIQTVGNHYKGKIREWTVVNEPFSRQLHTFKLNDWWYDHTGDNEYIDASFRWAREADPNAKLLVNDFNQEGPGPIADAMYNYVSGALQRGVPIDGIGMQMHIDGSTPPTKENVIKNMQRFADLGLEIYVTEFDVNMHFYEGTQEQRMAREASIYHDMLAACIESKVCHSFAFLGITDQESWYNELGFLKSEPLMFDRNYRPKPAFDAVRKTLSSP